MWENEIGTVEICILQSVTSFVGIRCSFVSAHMPSCERKHKPFCGGIDASSSSLVSCERKKGAAVKDTCGVPRGLLLIYIQDRDAQGGV